MSGPTGSERAPQDAGAEPCEALQWRSCLGSGGSRRNLPPLSPPAGPAPAAEASDDEDEERDAAACDDGSGSDPPLKISPGVEEHRVDPALREALDRLDVARQSQPVMADFALENYLGHCLAQAPTPPAEEAAAQRVVSGGGGPISELRGPPCFSLDLLMAAVGVAAPPPPQYAGAVGVPPWPLDASRSTSPGSTQTSSLSGISFGSSSGSSRPPMPPSLAPAAAAATVPGVREPAPPVPRRPGRRRPNSARGGRIQAAAEAAAADLGMYTAR
mmetsp:Transcript_119189/g.243768  ORF Transcript_119189/g.243768 Transcript_119189/m.243768 type:complete len:273 (+) Transcript_119189:36-854(+)